MKNIDSLQSLVVVLLIELLSSWGIHVLRRFCSFDPVASPTIGAGIATDSSSLAAVPDSDADHVLLVPVGAESDDVFVDQGQQFVLQLNSH